jgi:hypothetical protein
MFLDLKHHWNINVSTWIIQAVPGEKVSILGGHSIILSKKSVYVRFLFRTVSKVRDISLYSLKIVDRKEILCTVSNSGIYC